MSTRLSQFTAIALGLVVFLTQDVVVASGTAQRRHRLQSRDVVPYMVYDLNTISTCSYWYDNFEGRSCQVVRDWMFAISPEDFHRWNPSVGLDCSNWNEWSYCVEVEGEPRPSPTHWDPYSSTSATSTTSSNSMTTATPTPTLSGWDDIGCFVNAQTLSNRSTKAGGSGLTVDSCETACVGDGFTYAGVKAGTECWCGVFVGNGWTLDQKDCNMTCPGNLSQTCGGSNVFNIFEAQFTLPPSSTATTTSTGTSVTATKTTTSSTLPPPTSSSSMLTTSSTTTTAQQPQPTDANDICISGTVAPGMSGNYLGLCQYACRYGYCPLGPCVCSQYGSAAPAPASNGRDGCPASGLDESYKGLCSFTCNHGYCPEGACVYC